MFHALKNAIVVFVQKKGAIEKLIAPINDCIKLCDIK
jgi:hypothetical protein